MIPALLLLTGFLFVYDGCKTERENAARAAAEREADRGEAR